MNESIEYLLNEEIVSEIKDLGRLELGGKPYENAINGVASLCSNLIELKKLENEKELKNKQREVEVYLKSEEIESENKDRKMRNCIAVATIIIPLAVGSFWSYKSLRFEEEGTITTVVGKNMMNGLTKFKFWK